MTRVDRRLVAGEAERVGFVAPATIWAAEATYAKPRLARIQWDTRETVGWSELAGAKLAAAAGVRPRAGAALRCTGRPPEGLCGTLVAPGAR